MRRGAIGTLAGGLTLLALGTIAPMSAQAAVTCTKAQTITGAHHGVINVAGGQKLCMQGVTQDAAVNVAPQGQLAVRGGSIITGAVSLKSGYTAFEFCGSRTVGGAISATGGRSTPLIGNGGTCAANTIDGAVTLTSNKNGIMLAGNHINGAVVASGNIEGGLLGIGAGPMRISANQIGGALTCTGNTPAPKNAGASNAVVGGRSGQTCASPTF
jgi:hexosaminidase